MSSKKMIGVGMFVGSLVGGYVPVLFGVGGLSFIPLVTSAIGGVIGIYLAYKLTH